MNNTLKQVYYTQYFILSFILFLYKSKTHVFNNCNYHHLTNVAEDNTSAHNIETLTIGFPSSEDTTLMRASSQTNSKIK